MRHRSNKSTLMLLEIMINICFFAALIAICFVLLFRAFHISNRAVGVNHGVSILNSIAAVYESSNGDYDAILSRFPEADTDDQTLLFYYDEAFQATVKSDASYQAVLTSGSGASANEVRTAHLAFEQIKNQELLYEEDLAIHVPFSIEPIDQR